MLKFCILLSARLPLPVITVPLLAVQSGLPGCLAFEPLYLNTCAWVGAGGCAHAHTCMGEAVCLGRALPSHLIGQEQGSFHRLLLVSASLLFGTYLPP